MAREMGMSANAIWRIWQGFGLQPHRSETFKLSSDPLFVEKIKDICGLYLNPPEHAVVLCVDERVNPSAGSHPTNPAVAPRDPRARHPRLQTARHVQPVRGARPRDRNVIGSLHNRHRVI
jgi:hypothetical protein